MFPAVPHDDAVEPVDPGAYEEDPTRMAGRGADVHVKLLTTGEVVSLSVGLHTPLGIFRRQLENLTRIMVRATHLSTVAGGLACLCWARACGRAPSGAHVWG